MSPASVDDANRQPEEQRCADGNTDAKRLQLHRQAAAIDSTAPTEMSIRR